MKLVLNDNYGKPRKSNILFSSLSFKIISEGMRKVKVIVTYMIYIIILFFYNGL